MKNMFLYFSLIIFCSSCLKVKNGNGGFVQYIESNKNNISIYIINMEATADFNELYYANYDNNQNIFDEAGTLIGNYNIPEGHKLFGNYDITDNWEETFHGYMVLNENAIHIGQYIRNIKRQKNEMYIMLNCIIDSEGKVILKEFTKQNLGKPIAVVFEDKIIVVTVMREIIENEIAFGIRY